jgi:glycosyltransferase involved in cell wall biosynthesis
VSDIDKALAFEWIAAGLSKKDFDLGFVLINSEPSELEFFLLKLNLPVRRIASKGHLAVFFQLFVFLIRNRPDVVHCHLRRAELVGIAASYILRIRKRIFTRHSSTYNHLYHPKGVWLDKIVNFFASDIVAISENVKSILIEMEGVKAAKIHLVHHGFDLKYFSEVNYDEIMLMKQKYGIPLDRKIIGIIARYTWWKGYFYSLPAIGRFIREHPSYCLVIANANGNNAVEIVKVLDRCFNSGDYVQIKFEPNLQALYHTFDLYVHVPFDPQVEAFGQTFIEALAAGIPSVFTMSGVAREFVKHDYNALVVDFKNEEQITSALERLSKDEGLREKLQKNGRESVQTFDLQRFIERLSQIYLQ